MRGWLEKHYRQYLEAVRILTPANRDIAEAWAEWMKRQWDEHGKTSISQQKGLLREIRSALKADLGEKHIASETMKFSTEEWIKANRSTFQRVAEQNSEQRILSPKVVNTIVTRAIQLLSSREWADIAVGITVLTGRRSTEVMKTAIFTPKTNYSVIFTGALKRQDETTPVIFEIPTLCQAEYILKATQRLREIAPTADLTTTQVNTRYSRAIAQSCNRYFSDIVEPPKGKDNLYTHLFRKIYATIATYFYCPLNVDEAEYRAEIQGHFLQYENLPLSERRSIASDRNYRAYIILDKEGRSQKGIRLKWPDVKVIEAFTTSSPPFSQQSESAEFQLQKKVQLTMASEPKIEKRDPTSLSIWRDEKERWNVVLEKIAPEHTNRKEDRVSHLLKWIEHQLNSQDSTPVEIVTGENVNSKLQEHNRAIAQLRGEIEILKVGLSRNGNDSLIEAKVIELEQENIVLAEENATLKLERDQAIAKLNQFRALLTEDDAERLPQESEQVDYQDKVSIHTDTYDLKQRIPQLSTQQKQTEEQLDPDIVRALEAVISYNDSCTTHTEKWAISYPVMKDLLTKIGKATQSKIKTVFDAREQQIDQHHRKHSLGRRHNRKHQNESITDVIQDFS